MPAVTDNIDCFLSLLLERDRADCVVISVCYATLGKRTARNEDHRAKNRRLEMAGRHEAAEGWVLEKQA